VFNDYFDANLFDTGLPLAVMTDSERLFKLALSTDSDRFYGWAVVTDCERFAIAFASAGPISLFNFYS
jgi:hypothetical protein